MLVRCLIMYLTKQERERIVFGEFSVAAGLMPEAGFAADRNPNLTSFTNQIMV